MVFVAGLFPGHERFWSDDFWPASRSSLTCKAPAGATRSKARAARSRREFARRFFGAATEQRGRPASVLLMKALRLRLPLRAVARLAPRVTRSCLAHGPEKKIMRYPRLGMTIRRKAIPL
jgi:hypothetical protein